MRSNRQLNTWEKKELARRKYNERQIERFINWSIENKGHLKYKDLEKYSKKYTNERTNAIRNEKKN